MKPCGPRSPAAGASDWPLNQTESSLCAARELAHGQELLRDRSEFTFTTTTTLSLDGSVRALSLLHNCLKDTAAEGREGLGIFGNDG
uniref:Uncharacterized protein n=1 Tax=Knipowitschia caucasica TaxID=637954 RepID=A0AAV2K3Y7_KNICA